MERSRGSRLTTQSLVSEMNSTSSSTTNNTHNGSSNPCRISPSPGGMRIWEIRNAILKNSGRGGQLRWRGVNGCEYPWFDPLASDDTDTAANDDDADAVMDSDVAVRRNKSKHQIKNTTTTTNTKSIKKNHHQYTTHLYRPINPYTNTVSKLPAHSPLFTHYKRRLPNRADVGFGNPSETDVRCKMMEVQRECEWQECSPRIVCLTSGFFIGCSSSTDNSNDDPTVIHDSCRHEMEAWYGGRIPGIPFAGRDLIDCYKMYRRFEEEYNNNNNNNSCTGSNNKQTTIIQQQKQQHSRKERDRIKDPRTYSIFAPPIDATPSKSNALWKERPFDDRPPGMRYVLACPCDLRLEEDDDEPLFCSMALYLLPRREENGGTTSTISPNTNNNTIKFRGKISEEFHFPAGNWNAIEGGHSEEQSWKRRKRRAVFSYDPLDCEVEDLFLVVQVFRVARGGGGIGTDGLVGDGNDGKRKGLGNKIKGTFKKSKSRTDIAEDLPNSKSSVRMIDPSIGEYGPKFLTPVCFTVIPASPITENSADMQYWPAGETVHAPFYAYPDGSVTQEDFMDLLSTLSESQRTEYSSTANDNIREVNDESNDGHSSKNPQLLADVMGDSAISFDGVNAEEYNNNKHLRTKIRRLPPTPASGYTSSFDIKEVLYMPPRVSPRKYEEDAGLNTTSFLNLIYIYPRLIRITGGDTNGRKLSLRIRVVEQELHEQSFDGADAVYQPSHLVYNPSCPAGPPLVESFYTKLVMAKKQPESKGRFDLPLRDEVKIRLPDVLDRRHFLQFSLLSISDGLDDTTVIADTVVPFIISSKESSTGGRVTTIIPNGLHRIQLGNEFQIHVETRLESSTHVSDAAVATLLRDHPILSLPGDSSNQLTVAPFVDMLSMASNQAIRRHFFPLVTIQILGLLNQECCMFYYESLGDMFGSDNSWHRLVPRESIDTLVASMRCLFEILDKTRTSFGEKDHSSLPIKYQQWIKLFIDSFDEKLFLLR
eukprot:scaffold13999_cov34-Cyclotella_meneghiniana.AAC.2